MMSLPRDFFTNTIPAPYSYNPWIQQQQRQQLREDIQQLTHIQRVPTPPVPTQIARVVGGDDENMDSDYSYESDDDDYNIFNVSTGSNSRRHSLDDGDEELGDRRSGKRQKRAPRDNDSTQHPFSSAAFQFANPFAQIATTTTPTSTTLPTPSPFAVTATNNGQQRVTQPFLQQTPQSTAFTTTTNNIHAASNPFWPTSTEQQFGQQQQQQPQQQSTSSFPFAIPTVAPTPPSTPTCTEIIEYRPNPLLSSLVSQSAQQQQQQQFRHQGDLMTGRE